MIKEISLGVHWIYCLKIFLIKYILKNILLVESVWILDIVAHAQMH